jgi:elongation factor Ts
MRQAYIRDQDLTIEKLVLQTIGSTGENIVVRRFQRWELGEKLDE